MIESETVSVRSGTRTNTKLCEGWLEHKSHKANGHEYVRLWLVLKGNILYIFKDRDTSTESPLGSLTIDTHTKFKTEQGDSSKGYKFDLITNTKSNRFKSKKLAERELWRGYILGVASGIVPYDLDLLENQIDTIKSVITEYVTGQSGGLIRNRVSMISGSSMESHESGIVEGSLCSGFSAASGGKSVSGSDGSGGGGGPIRTDKFYNERTPDQKTPSWFFSGCSREKAEQILTQYADHGNTLMRESTTHMKSGSYVISKRLFDKKTNDHAYEHYEVVRVAGGYKLNIQNEVRTKVQRKNPVRDEDPLEHRPMQCLTDVMEYFRETSGRDTRLLDTNDPYRMGPASDPQYQKQIKRSVDTEPWAWPPPDYEDPTDQAQGSNSRYPGMGAKTVSPGILKNPKSGNSRKTVDFTRNTISASSIRDHRHQTTIGDIEQRVHAAAHLKQLDAMIDSFETNNIYVNDEPMKQPDTDTVDASVLLRKQMPLPPTPHEHIAHDYMNTDLAALGVAPPPPRVPTVPNISGVDNMGAIPIPPPPPPPPPLLPCQQGPDPLSPTGQVQPSSKLQVIKAIAPPKPAPKPASSRQFTIGKTPASNRFDNSANGRLSNNPKSPNKIASVPAFNLGEDIAQQRLQLRKTQSVGTGLGSSKINPQSPDSMPTWDNKPKAAISPSGITSGANKTPQFNLTGPVKQEEETSGVDDSNPGGVQNLSQMFQNITQAKTKRANMPQRSVTVHGGPRPTIVESGERKSQLVNGPKVSPKPQTSTGFKPPSTEALSHRRQTDPGPITPQFQGLHDSFKRKLEGVIGGAPITGIPNQVEHEYEELPIIKPDSVTYANDFID